MIGVLRNGRNHEEESGEGCAKYQESDPVEPPIGIVGFWLLL